ncbi:MAG: putative sugar nucleotidyl transferase [Phycisphaerae bacterium]|jgi:UDP-N-acetylglucosamine diphosphorylase/glucosamine-1-phosphate N-acetyltransferase|nr:putative sugar nucleotidyl transferase [Phycisphaerae bacterium]
MKLVIFEDGNYGRLFPISIFRPVFELRCGATSLREKILRRFLRTDAAYFIRDELVAVFSGILGGPVNDMDALRGDDVLLVNGCWLAGSDDNVPASDGEEVGFSGDVLVYAFAKAQTIEECQADSIGALLDALKGRLPNVQTEATVIEWPWDLVRHNTSQLVVDFDVFGKWGIEGTMSEHAAVWGDKEKVYLAKTATVHPFVCLDTTSGPIYIDEGAAVHPQTRIEGPCYVGRDSMIVGGKIREGVSIGPVCRVGGEVEESIIHGYSNKYHDGFLGHAYVCEWVNLGADTTNSDLKNDYSSVTVVMPDGPAVTGMTKVGSFIGDHTKTSIGTFFNTGAYVGVCTNVVGVGGIQPKFIPSFVRMIGGRAFKASLDEIIETERTAMGRRDVELTDEDVELFKHALAITKEARDKVLAKARREILTRHRIR